MVPGSSPAEWLSTPSGRFPLEETRLTLAGRPWRLLHAGALVTGDDEAAFLLDPAERRPYGIALWPAALALAGEIAQRREEFAGRRVLELGAGAGLPGLVAASLGARVLQTDRDPSALEVCRRNAERNGLAAVERLPADWATWQPEPAFDWLLGADILYSRRMHPHLRRLFEAALAPGGRVLVADPFRREGLALLEALAAAGWNVAGAKWRLGEGGAARAVGVFELTPP